MNTHTTPAATRFQVEQLEGRARALELRIAAVSSDAQRRILEQQLAQLHRAIALA